MQALRTSGARTERGSSKVRKAKRMHIASGNDGYAPPPHISVEASCCMVPAPDERSSAARARFLRDWNLLENSTYPNW